MRSPARWLPALLAAALPAQGHVRWPSPAAPVGAVVQTGPATWRVHFGGFTTIAAGGPLVPDCVGCTLATPTHGVTVTKVSSAELEDESTGTTGFTAPPPLLPFATSTSIGSGFQQLQPTLNVVWNGFWAQASRPMPAFLAGALAFDLETVSGADFAAVQADLAQGALGVAEADAAGSLTGQHAFVFAPPLTIVPALILAHAFDRGAGPLSVNEAGFPGAPPHGQVVTNDTTGWAQGRFGSALRGASATGRTYCATGWHGGIAGSLTIAWWMRERTPPGSQVSDLFGGLGTFRCFTGGPAGTGLWCAGWSPGAPPLVLTDDIQAQAAAQWVHVALAIDGSATPPQAAWYVNGARRAVIALPMPASLPASPTDELLLGRHQVDQTASRYDLDQIELWGVALDATRVAGLAAGPGAAAAAFGSACGAVLRHEGGAPALGNAAYQLRLEGPGGRPCALTAGAGTSLNGIPLPIDLGFLAPNLAGCPWLSDLTVVLPGTTDASGMRVIPLPIPSTPSLLGATLYAQALALDPSGQLQASNAHQTAVR